MVPLSYLYGIADEVYDTDEVSFSQALKKKTGPTTTKFPSIPIRVLLTPTPMTGAAF